VLDRAAFEPDARVGLQGVLLDLSCIFANVCREPCVNREDWLFSNQGVLAPGEKPFLFLVKSEFGVLRDLNMSANSFP